MFTHKIQTVMKSNHLLKDRIKIVPNK